MSLTSSTNPTETLEQATQRADRAEQELRNLKKRINPDAAPDREPDAELAPEPEMSGRSDGIETLRSDSMMAHLLGALDQGEDIGHYGRLVFTMVALRFLPEDAVAEWLSKDQDVDREKAMNMIRQVQGRGYNPPRRERILEWQTQQEFQILPSPDDPDCGNVYKSLKFPEEVYEHIQHYQSDKLEAEDSTA
jgi:hypothetical protein